MNGAAETYGISFEVDEDYFNVIHIIDDGKKPLRFDDILLWLCEFGTPR